MKRIGIITYDANHLKTEQIVLRLAGTYDMSIYALPFVQRPSRSVLLQHRPNQMLGATPRELAQQFNFEFWAVKSDKDIPNECDLYLITGAGILSGDCLRGKKVLNCHPGIIPAARGLDAFKWSIYKQLPVGNTLHYVDEQVDVGEIVSVIPTPVFASDTIEIFARRHYENEINLMCKFEYYLEHPQNVYQDIPMQDSTRRMPWEKEQALEECFRKFKQKFVQKT